MAPRPLWPPKTRWGGQFLWVITYQGQITQYLWFWPILFLSTFSGGLGGLKPILQPPDPWNDSPTPWNELATRNYMGINDFIWKPPQKQNKKKQAKNRHFGLFLGGFGFFLWGCHIKPALFRSFLAKIYHPQEKTTLKISIMMGTGR